MPGEDLVAKAAAKVERFLRESGQFQATCNSTFAQLDWQHTGRVATSDAVAATGAFFEQMAGALEEYGMVVEEPSRDEVRGLLAGCGLAGVERLNRDQFEALYLAVLKVAAGKCVRSFVRKYGTGILVGTASLFVFKRVVRSVPVVGLVAGPLLALVPTLLAGPVLGMLGVYAADHGGVGAVKDLLSSVRGGGGGGGFIRG